MAPPKATAGQVGEALVAATDALAAAGVAEARLDAEVMLGHAMGWDRARIVANADAGVPADAGRRFGEMVRRRARREPVAYIVGSRWFRNLELEVDPRVLIPRPESELLVELALELGPGSVLDVGTGSGAIALAIAEELPDCAVMATDSSAAALEVARANAKRLGLAQRVRFFEGTLADLKPAPRADDGATGFEGSNGDGGVDGVELVVANLPYIAEADWASLQPEITRWEPPEALLSGADGLDAIRGLVPECARLLSGRAGGAGPSVVGGGAAGRARVAGVLGLEVGQGQAETVAGLLNAGGFEEIEIRRDLAGIERVVVGRSP